MSEDSRSSDRIIRLSPYAVRDLAAIHNYTAEQWSEEQAEEYRAFLRTVMHKLAVNPPIASFVKNLNGVRSYVARWNNTRQGHRIFFKEIENGIAVLRILHTSMNWPESPDR